MPPWLNLSCACSHSGYRGEERGVKKKESWSRALLILTAVILVPAAARAQEVTPDSLLQQQLNSLDMAQVQSFLDEIDREVGEYLPDLSLGAMIRAVREGQLHFSLRDILAGLARYLFRELLADSHLLGQLLILAILAAVLQNLQAAFEQNTVSQTAYTVVFLVLITLAMSSFTVAVTTGRETIANMTGFIYAILPVVLTLMASVGGIVSASLLHPMVLGAIGVLTTVVTDIVFPLIYLAAILGIVTRITDRVPVSRLAGLAKDIATAAAGITLTLFLGLLVIQGLAGTAADSLTLRTAKYMTGAFIPVVGKVLTDAVEVVAGTSLLLKDAVGLVGALAIVGLSVFPALKILSLVVIYKLSAALVQPFGDSRIADSLDFMGNSLILVFAAVIAVGLMFFMVLAIIVGLGNITVMLR
ncbi:MAG: stage III sporulation protein AE [Clostridia bacterium]|nr:MAG: stage III sporulation protein AE [Clostridia bacterium]